MFSIREKQYIAYQIEKLLLSLNHPEMPKKNPDFTFHVKGIDEDFSWADIQPNWKFGIDNPPKVNPFNEVARDILTPQKEDNKGTSHAD